MTNYQVCDNTELRDWVSFCVTNSSHLHQPPNANDSPLHHQESITSKKEEFRKYLDRTGVIEALTKVLVGLYEEPERHQINALDYVKQYLGAPSSIDLEGLKKENETLKSKVASLEKQLGEVTRK